MSIAEQLGKYDFTNFTLGHIDPKGNRIAEVMEEVPRNSETHIALKTKLDKEFGFHEKKSRGIPYPTLIKYLALALEDMRNN